MLLFSSSELYLLRASPTVNKWAQVAFMILFLLPDCFQFIWLGRPVCLACVCGTIKSETKKWVAKGEKKVNVEHKANAKAILQQADEMALEFFMSWFAQPRKETEKSRCRRRGGCWDLKRGQMGIESSFMEQKVGFWSWCNSEKEMGMKKWELGRFPWSESEVKVFCLAFNYLLPFRFDLKTHK